MLGLVDLWFMSSFKCLLRVMVLFLQFWLETLFAPHYTHI